MLERNIAEKTAAVALEKGVDVVEFGVRERGCGSLSLRPYLWGSPRPPLLDRVYPQPAYFGLLAAGQVAHCLYNRLVRRSTFLAVAEDIPPTLMAKKVSFGEDWFYSLLIAKHARAYTAIADTGYRYLQNMASVTYVNRCNFSAFLKGREDFCHLMEAASILFPNNAPIRSSYAAQAAYWFLVNGFSSEQNATALNRVVEMLHFDPLCREKFLLSLATRLLNRHSAAMKSVRRKWFQSLLTRAGGLFYSLKKRWHRWTRGYPGQGSRP
jgi:hypothetical protein